MSNIDLEKVKFYECDCGCMGGAHHWVAAWLGDRPVETPGHELIECYGLTKDEALTGLEENTLKHMHAQIDGA